MARHSTWRGYLDATQREMKSWSMWYFYVRGIQTTVSSKLSNTALTCTKDELPVSFYEKLCESSFLLSIL